MRGLMERVGRAVGRLHEIGICHGDLTTSNLMLRREAPSHSTTMTPERSEAAETSATRSHGRQTTASLREAAMSGLPPPSPIPQRQPEPRHQQQHQQQPPSSSQGHTSIQPPQIPGPRGRQTTSSLREAAMSGLPPPSSSSNPTHPPPPLSSLPPIPPLTGAITLIDLGLATQTVQDEDRAVDLYVLEKAFVATHPGAAEVLFRECVLGGKDGHGYGGSFKGAGRVLRRLEEVRGRGRKRGMVG